MLLMTDKEVESNIGRIFKLGQENAAGMDYSYLRYFEKGFCDAVNKKPYSFIVEGSENPFIRTYALAYNRVKKLHEKLEIEAGVHSRISNE